MSNILQKKIPASKHYAYNIIDVVVSTILTFVCVIAFKPSFISTIRLADQLIIAAIISFVVLIVLLLKVVFVSKMMSSGRWNLKMDLITLFIEFFVISVLLLALSPLVIKSWLKLAQPIDSNYVLVMVAFVHFIGFLLYFVSISAKYIINGSPDQNQNSVEVAIKSESLLLEEHQPEQTVEKTTIVLEGKNQGEKLEIDKNDLVCISTDGHYIDIYFLDEDEPSGFQKVIFRNSIHSKIQKLEEHDEFIHCHRSHLINVNHIEEVIGNSKKMEVKLTCISRNIPISRGKVSLLKEKLKN